MVGLSHRLSGDAGSMKIAEYCHWLVVILVSLLGHSTNADDVIRSAKSGAWSSPATWDGGKVPGDGAKVLIRPNHKVTYDVASDAVIRTLQVGGTLSFVRDRDTL